MATVAASSGGAAAQERHERGRVSEAGMRRRESWKNRKSVSYGEETTETSGTRTEQVAPWIGVKSTRLKIYYLLSEPDSSFAAKCVSLFIILLVIISATAFIVESLPEFHRKNETFWFILESIIVGCFTIEFVTRILTCPDLRDFVKDALNIIDFLAIFPFYVELIFMLAGSDTDLVGLSVLRILRVVRIFRVFKLSKYIAGMRLFGRTIAASADALVLLIFYMTIAVLLFASVLYYAERGEWDSDEDDYFREDGTPSPFNSIPASCWFTVVTMTTVGFGDVVPVTLLGKLVASLCMLAGFIIIALPITVIGTHFADQYTHLKREFMVKDATESSHAKGNLQEELVCTTEEVENMLDDVVELIKETRGRIMLLSELHEAQAAQQVIDAIPGAGDLKFARKSTLSGVAFQVARSWQSRSAIDASRGSSENNDDRSPVTPSAGHVTGPRIRSSSVTKKRGRNYVSRHRRSVTQEEIPGIVVVDPDAEGEFRRSELVSIPPSLMDSDEGALKDGIGEICTSLPSEEGST